VARDLAGHLNNTELRSIPKVEEVDFSADSIGIVFPVYLWGMPEIVSDFIKKMKGATFAGYLYAIATYNEQPGDVIGQVRSLLKKNGLYLSAGFTVSMPGNNIIYYKPEPKDMQDKKIIMCKEMLADISRTIRDGKKTYPSASLTDKFLKTGLLYPILLKTFRKSDKNFRCEEECSGCGICAKVCPAENISLIDYRPVWGHKCLQCVSCINLCPQQAIQFGKTTKGRERYINPETSIKDFI
jgi:ferredoxin